MSNEYAVLLERARDALHDLIMASEPGRHLLPLLVAYDSTKMSLSATESRATRDERAVDRRRRRAAWTSLTMPARERVLLEQLRDDRLTVRELTERVTAELPDYVVYATDVQRLVRCLYLAGELARSEARQPGGARHRYHRNRDLSGPIVDLERAFNEENE